MNIFSLFKGVHFSFFKVLTLKKGQDLKKSELEDGVARRAAHALRLPPLPGTPRTMKEPLRTVKASSLASTAQKV